MSEKNNKVPNRKGIVKEDCKYCDGSGSWNIRGLINSCMCTKVKHVHSDGINNLVENSIRNILKQVGQK